MHINSTRLRELRIARQWSQEQLANLSGLNLRTIQRLESGAKISTESLRALAAVFEMPAESLLVGNPTPSQPALEAMREGVMRGLEFTGTTPRADFWWFALAVAMVLALAQLFAEAVGPLPLQIASLLVLLPWLASCALSFAALLWLRRPRLRDVLIAIACVPLVMGLPALAAYAVVGTANRSSNPVVAGMGAMPWPQAISMFALTGVQLLGEELVTILPLLVLLTLLYRSGMRRGPAIAIAWVATALVFGALHLPTYQWHVGQALLVIGTARLALTGIYLLTRNLWASTIAHVVNDWSMMALMMLAAAMREAG